MSYYQPRFSTDPVWMNGVKANDLDVNTTGVGVLIDGISGWDDLVEVRDVRETKPVADGEDSDTSYLGGRTITVYGTVFGSTWANLQTRKRTLAVTFAPTSSEVLFKVPDPSTASPTAVYATTGMSGYERASVKVVEGIAWGDVTEGISQSFQVVLRASDPLIYSDTETTDDATIGSYAGTAATPLTVDFKIGLNAASATNVYDATSGVNYIEMFPTALTSSGYTAANYRCTLNAKEKTATVYMPQNSSRLDGLDPVAFWRLNETSGSTFDNAQGTAARDGTKTGTPTLNQTGPVTDTKSIYFRGDGSGYTDGVSLTYTASYFTDEWMMDLWAAPATLTGGESNRRLIDFSGDTSTETAGWGMTLNPSQVIISKGGVLSIASTIPLVRYAYTTSNAFKYIALTYAYGSLKLYVNGVLVSVCRTTITGFGSGTLYFGGTASVNPWKGNLSSVGFYPKAHSAATISALYNSGGATSSLGGLSGQFIENVYNYPTLSAAKTITSTTGSDVITTYRAARF